jgi:hypothetical protein
MQYVGFLPTTSPNITLIFPLATTRGELFLLRDDGDGEVVTEVVLRLGSTRHKVID